ncbi:hypothetical protein WA026_010950 [Henosepilachna vigintioctopunctata]|uniref:Protein msta n=1 Tax=Henosepilachna vigintioctopunctata TaxID=420089 RepID=A0AAW1UQJ8_9CUCU
MSQICAICKKAAVQSCSACNSTYYCSKEHQKLHWKTHKSSCAPFKIKSDEFGKSLVAIRDIKQGEKILTKLPILIGPKSEKEIICFNCFKKIEETSNVKCILCGLKLCGKLCQNKEGHLKICDILQASKITVESCPNIYQYSIALNILIIKTTDFKKYDVIMSNYSYQEPKDNFKNIISDLLILCEKLALPTTEEELRKLFVISKRNFIDISHNKSDNIKGLYPVIPFLNQSCVPNTKQVFYEDANQLSVLATVPIKKGDILTANFSDILWGTLERQIFLKTKKFINCSCTRCADPTEMKTYAGSIYCQKCKDNLLEDDSPKVMSTNPLDIDADWACEICNHKIQAKQIVFGNKSLNREINDKNMVHPKSLEHFLFKYGEILHPTNSFSLKIKFKLIQIYGNSEEFKLSEMPEALLERKVQLCHDLLEVADYIDPGYSRFRGILLYELQSTMVMQAKKLYCKDLITKSDAEDKLRKSLDILHESCKILLAEPDFKDILQEKLESLNNMIEI